MDCRDVEERLVPYLRGALDCDAANAIEPHISACADCSRRLAGEMIADLALSLPQERPPQSVKNCLMARVESEGTGKRAWAYPRAWFVNLSRTFRRRTALGLGGSAAVALVVLLLAGFWFNGKLSEASRDAAQLSDELALARERESAVMSAVEEHRLATYELIRMSSFSGVSVNNLRGTGQRSAARGVMMVSYTSNRGLLFVADLSPLPSDRVYQAWLTRDGAMYRAGWFTVDTLGYGQMVVIPIGPFGHFDGMVITIEPRAGNAAPTGESVLKGDL